MKNRTLALLVVALVGCGDGGSSGGGSSGGSGGGGGGGGGGSSPSAFFPAWSGIAPTSTTTLNYNSGQTATQNGSTLAAAINALTPGQKLIVGAGTWSINLWFNITVDGTAAAPIWVEGVAGTILTRPDNAQNVINVGSSGNPSSYLCLKNLEITGGSDLIKLYAVNNIWIDQCHIHNGDGVGIAANSANTSYLYITRNHIHHPGGAGATGECMYLGANNGTVTMSNSVIAQNHVHDTYGTTQGDGIEVKQGSYGNWIVENYVHHTNYPCILVYGTAGMAFNIVERNVCHDSNDNTIQIQGEAVVRNNLIMAGATGFASTDHQGLTVNLTFVHNTIVNVARAANLSSWNNRAGMVFANNAVYSQTQESIRFPNGSLGVALAGNVVLGPVVGASTGYTGGTGLGDFTNVTWDALNRNGLPSNGSPLIGAGSATYSVVDDINAATRVSALDTGAWDKP